MVREAGAFEVIVVTLFELVRIASEAGRDIGSMTLSSEKRRVVMPRVAQDEGGALLCPTRYCGPRPSSQTRHHIRHCEPEAKQSSLSTEEPLDCFAPLAMTVRA